MEEKKSTRKLNTKWQTGKIVLNSYQRKGIHSKTYILYAAKSLQSCPTLCDPRDGSPPGFPVSRILQARKLEWVAISFSNAWKWKVKVKSLSRIPPLATPWTAAYQAPPPMEFSRQDYWSGVPLPSPIHLISSPKFPRNTFTFICLKSKPLVCTSLLCAFPAISSNAD